MCAFFSKLDESAGHNILRNQYIVALSGVDGSTEASLRGVLMWTCPLHCVVAAWLSGTT